MNLISVDALPPSKGLRKCVILRLFAGDQHKEVHNINGKVKYAGVWHKHKSEKCDLHLCVYPLFSFGQQKFDHLSLQKQFKDKLWFQESTSVVHVIWIWTLSDYSPVAIVCVLLLPIFLVIDLFFFSPTNVLFPLFSFFNHTLRLISLPSRFHLFWLKYKMPAIIQTSTGGKKRNPWTLCTDFLQYIVKVWSW